MQKAKEVESGAKTDHVLTVREFCLDQVYNIKPAANSKDEDEKAVVPMPPLDALTATKFAEGAPRLAECIQRERLERQFQAKIKDLDRVIKRDAMDGRTKSIFVMSPNSPIRERVMALFKEKGYTVTSPVADNKGKLDDKLVEISWPSP